MKCKYETDSKAEMCSTTCKTKDFARRQEALIRLCRDQDSEECKTYKTVQNNMKMICDSMMCTHGIVHKRASSASFTPKLPENNTSLEGLKAFRLTVPNANVQDKIQQCEASCKTTDFARRQLVLERLCKEGDSQQCDTYKIVVKDMKTICDKMTCD